MLEGVQGFLDNLPHVFTLYNMTIILLGSLGGLILGALPGVSPTMSVALLVPFTFYMDPTSGLILLGAVYASSVAGGAISAVLINIPGAPANIATVLDGYPMAKAGKAQLALYTSFISTFIGGVVGMIVMILLTLPLAEVALKFGSTELFWISILGLTVVAGLSSGNMVKSLIAGAFGVWLSTIGPNPMTGEFRFIFHDVLEGGINIIPALIGLFAVPQIFSLVEYYGKTRSEIKFKAEKGIFLKTFVSTIKMVRVQVIGSIVGTVIGLIPGVGGQVSGIVSYDQSKKFSRHPEKYGTGIPDGVAAAESANNAMVGPSLVPLLTLSIPGSPTAAVLLGGLLIHGIFPGPDLFRYHSDLVHTFIGALLVTQAAMLLFGIMLSRHSHWVMRVPDLYMAASIVVLAVFGTYSVNNNFNDVIVMFGIGLLMYGGTKFGFSPAPVVMGLILGGIAENSLLKGMLIAEAGKGMLYYFFTGWLNIILILFSVASIVFGIFSAGRGGGKKRMGKADVGAAIVVLLSAVVIYSALHVRDHLSALFPVATLLAMGVLSVILLVQGVISLRKKEGAEKAATPAYPFPRILLALVLIVIYLYLLNYLGFYLSSFVFYLIFISILMLSSKLLFERIHIRVVVSVLFVVILYLLFNVLLKVSAPTGLVI